MVQPPDTSTPEYAATAALAQAAQRFADAVMATGEMVDEVRGIRAVAINRRGLNALELGEADAWIIDLRQDLPEDYPSNKPTGLGAALRMTGFPGDVAYMAGDILPDNASWYVLVEEAGGAEKLTERFENAAKALQEKNSVREGAEERSMDFVGKYARRAPQSPGHER